MTTLSINIPAHVEEPRGSVWFAQGMSAVLVYMQSRALERSHVAQARSDARSKAKHVKDARAMAQEMGRQDPRAAADLMAAIDRYEGQA